MDKRLDSQRRRTLCAGVLHRDFISVADRYDRNNAADAVGLSRGKPVFALR
jgi:hypothetical protein